MTTKANDTPTYYATRDFTDAGTERSFEKGKSLENVDEATALNYAAAGAASTEKPEASEPAAAKANNTKPSDSKPTA